MLLNFPDRIIFGHPSEDVHESCLTYKFARTTCHQGLISCVFTALIMLHKQENVIVLPFELESSHLST
jgi:hypothetical protein